MNDREEMRRLYTTRINPIVVDDSTDKAVWISGDGWLTRHGSVVGNDKTVAPVDERGLVVRLSARDLHLFHLICNVMVMASNNTTSSHVGIGDSTQRNVSNQRVVVCDELRRIFFARDLDEYK